MQLAFHGSCTDLSAQLFMASLLARVHMVMLLASYWQDSVACLGGGASVLCEAFAGVDGSAVVLHIHMYQGSSSGHDTARDSRGHQAHTQASETAVHWRGGLDGSLCMARGLCQWSLEAANPHFIPSGKQWTQSCRLYRRHQRHMLRWVLLPGICKEIWPFLQQQ